MNDLSRMDYDKVDIIPNSLCVIPYFNGRSKEKHSSNLTTLVYFIKCFYSVRKYFENTVVYVCQDEDYDEINNLKLEIDLRQIKPAHPRWLPVDALTAVQNTNNSAKYIAFSEADLVWHIYRSRNLIKKIDHGNYLIPYRLNKLLNDENANIIQRHNKVLYLDGHPYSSRWWKKPDGAGVYHPSGKAAFAGSWICSKEKFNTVSFIQRRKYAIEAACYSLRTTCKKHQVVKFNKPHHFFVEHLSSVDRVSQRLKRDVQLFPGAW